MTHDEELHRACDELQRLIGADAVAPTTLLRVFGDGDTCRQLSERPRSAGELRGFFDDAAVQSQNHDDHRDKDLALSSPSSTVVASNALAAFWRWVRAGFGVVDATTYARRIESCARCELYVEAPEYVLYAIAKTAARESRICSACGCFMAKKARLASESCPVNRWSK